MGKKILDRLIQEQTELPSSSEGNSIMDYVKNSASPLTREEANEQQVRQGFKGESQYDDFLGYGVDQNKLRARNQPWYDQLGNSLAKAIPGTALKILENAGDLGELVFDWDNQKEYTNIFTELAKKGQESLNDTFTTYQETPANEFASPADSGWWFNLGDGLVQSIGAFWVTGAGVGGALSKTAKAINGAIRGGELGLKVGQGAAQLGTASSLAYTEGIQSAAQVYQQTKDNLLQNGYDYGDGIKMPVDEVEAKRIASDAAAKTMALNTVLNTGLNITSLSPLFKSFGHLDNEVKKQLSRKVGEAIPAYIKRLEQLEAQGVKQASIMKTLSAEAFQEGIEEDVNVFAEGEGYREGQVQGMIKSKKASSVDRFFDTMFSEEGAINFLSGAVGGVAQTAGLTYAPLRTTKDDKGVISRVSARELEKLENQKAQKEVITTFKEDLKYLQEKQQELNKAIESKDKVAIDKARQDLFNIAALKSIRNETSEELAQEIAQVASVDNTKIGPDQLTDAQRQGLADNIDDNRYKEKALQTAADLRMLNKEYRDLQADTFSGNPFALNEAFRQRLGVHSAQTLLNRVHKDILESEMELTKLISDPVLQEAIKLDAQLQAYERAGKLAKDRDLSLPLEGSVAITEKLLSDLYKDHKGLKEKVKANTGIAAKLVTDYANRSFVQAETNKRQNAYKEILNKPKAFIKDINKKVETLNKVIEEKKKTEVAEASKAKQTEDFEKAKEKKKEEAAENPQSAPEEVHRVLLYGTLKDPETRKKALGEDSTTVPITTKGTVTNQNDLPNLEPGEDEVQGELLVTTGKGLAKLDEWEKDNYARVEHTLPTGEKVWVYKLKQQSSVAVEQVQTINPIDVAYHGKTLEEERQESEILEDIVSKINDENNSTNGEHNKIAYKAQEQNEDGSTVDPSIIDKLYKVNHSAGFGEGASVVIRPVGYKPDATDNEIDEMPMGIYYQDELIGWLPLPRNNKRFPQLLAARAYVYKMGSVTTTISKKTLGHLNKSKVKHTVAETFPILPTFAIGINEQFNVSYSVPFQGELVNKGLAKSGFVYTIVTTPNGKNIAVPADINTLTEEIASSVLTALKIFINAETIGEESKQVVVEVFDKYGIDITTQKGLQAYLNLFVYTTDLNPDTLEGALNIELFNEEKKNNFYIQASPTGIRFMESGKAITDKKGRKVPREVGKNTPKDKLNAFYKDLHKHLLGSYFKIDINMINSKAAFKAPLFREGVSGAVEYTEYSTPTYNQHVANNTRTNIIAVRLSNTEQTVLVQPTLFVDYSFLSDGKTITKPVTEKVEKVVILASNKGTSGVARNPNRRKNPNQATKDDANDLKNNCK